MKKEPTQREKWLCHKISRWLLDVASGHYQADESTADLILREIQEAAALPASTAAMQLALQKLIALYDQCTEVENFSDQWIDAIEEAKAALVAAPSIAELSPAKYPYDWRWTRLRGYLKQWLTPRQYDIAKECLEVALRDGLESPQSHLKAQLPSLAKGLANEPPNAKGKL